MKKVISSLLVMSMVLFGTFAKAGNITVEQAKVLGAYYMSYQMGTDKITPALLTLTYQFENPDMNVASAYVFNVGNSGWIIIAGSTVVDPVIAFSEEGSLDMSDIPDNLRWWLTRYTEVVADIQRIDAEKEGCPDSEEYTKLYNKGLGSAKDEKVILMSTSWDQGATRNPTYNRYCPQLNGRYSVTGCVATALAQICKYYEYPTSGKGVVSTTFHGEQLKVKLDTVEFDYSKMPWALTRTSSEEQIEQVAMLNYCLGLGVQMDYDPDGSGASMYDAITSMKYNFKYERGTMRMRNGTTDTAYMNKLRRQLMENDVVAMRGASSTGSGGDAAGHAWVADGYYREDTTKYHMNWGWGGTGNGWFNLAANDMRISSMGYNFNVDQGCVFGMVPPEGSNIHHGGHEAIREVDNTLLGTAYPNPATLSVALPYSTEMAGDMLVYGIDGRLVSTTHVQPGTGEVTLRVDALPHGVYIYRLNTQSGKFIVR